MVTTLLNSTAAPPCASKQVELIRINGKYYLEEFDNLDYIIELSIALAKENELLKERIQLLEDRLYLTANRTSKK